MEIRSERFWSIPPSATKRQMITFARDGNWKNAKRRQASPADDESTIGDCWADLCEDSRALAVYQRVSELHPELPEGWMGICRIHLLQGDFVSARKIYQENSSRYNAFAYTGQIAA